MTCNDKRARLGRSKPGTSRHTVTLVTVSQLPPAAVGRSDGPAPSINCPIADCRRSTVRLSDCPTVRHSTVRLSDTRLSDCPTLDCPTVDCPTVRLSDTRQLD